MDRGASSGNAPSRQVLAVVSGRLGLPDGYSFATALETGAYTSLRVVLSARSSAEVLEEVRRSGLTGGSGGAAFLTAQKWSLLSPGVAPVVVVNGDESEPGTVVVHPGAGAYVVGEETALLESLEGKRGFPRIKPQWYPAAKGYLGSPTVVNNVETLSALPWVMANGGAAFASFGSGRSLGTRLFCLSGPVRRPGLFEVELYRTTFAELIFGPSFGQGLKPRRQLTAIIPGASFPWLPAEQAGLPLDVDAVAANGSSLGSGVMVLDDATCPVRVAWRLVRFFHRESCGQCTPCREGTGWLEKVMRRIVEGCGQQRDLELLQDIGDNISPPPFPRAAWRGAEAVAFPYRQTTICPVGPSAVSPIASSMMLFREDYDAHIENGCCLYEPSFGRVKVGT